MLLTSIGVVFIGETKSPEYATIEECTPKAQYLLAEIHAGRIKALQELEIISGDVGCAEKSAEDMLKAYEEYVKKKAGQEI